MSYGPPQQQPPQKNKGAIIGAIVAIVIMIVGLLLITFLYIFKGGTTYISPTTPTSQLVGKWNIESIEYMGTIEDLPEGSYFDFKSNRTVTLSFSIPGSLPVTETLHYEDLGNGQVKFMNGSEMTSDYSIMGNTLTIDFSGMEMICTRA